jgi:hypothetical protein
MQSELKYIVWGNKLFVNAQFVLQLVNLISKYLEGKEKLKAIFDFANAIKKQQKIKVYPELDREVKEILYLENGIKEGSISSKDTTTINFILNSIIIIFTSKITRRD